MPFLLSEDLKRGRQWKAPLAARHGAAPPSHERQVWSRQWCKNLYMKPYESSDCWPVRVFRSELQLVCDWHTVGKIHLELLRTATPSRNEDKHIKSTGPTCQDHNYGLRLSVRSSTLILSLQWSTLEHIWSTQQCNNRTIHISLNPWRFALLSCINMSFQSRQFPSNMLVESHILIKVMKEFSKLQLKQTKSKLI